MAGKKKQYEDRTRELLENIVSGTQLEAVDVEYVRENNDYILRAFIASPDGVTLSDCENISGALGDALDNADFIEDAYILEVSSPGDRPFKSDRDFERNIGKDVSVTTYKEINGEKKHFGILKSLGNNEFTITDDDGNDITFDKKTAAAVRLSFRF